MLDVCCKVFQFLIVSVVDPSANVHYSACNPNYRKMHRQLCNKKQPEADIPQLSLKVFCHGNSRTFGHSFF